MHNIIKGIGALAVCLLITISCDEISFGNDFLGDQPESSGATTEEMFSKKINAEKVLVKAYSELPYGLPNPQDFKMGCNVIESITDLAHSTRDNNSDGPKKLYYNGALSPTNVQSYAAYNFGDTEWTAIRYAWMFIENVDQVPDMTQAEKNTRIAEAKMIIALCYFEMTRYIGGVPWIDHCIDVNEQMNFPRITFAQTIENIVKLLDEAIPYLKWKQDEINEGRMCKAGAMVLKFKVLHWAASPTFNSDTKWHPEADEYTCYGNYSKDRWLAAEAAGKAFFDELARVGGYALEQPAEPTHRARRLAYRKAYYQRNSSEVIISLRKGYDQSVHNDFIDSRLYSGPTLNYVNMFPWEDGTDFPENFNWEHPSKQPFFTEGDMIPTRDPRLYENVAVPGETYCNGTSAPVYTNHPSYRGAGTGFMGMKFILQEWNDRTTPAHWPHTRLAEVMLSYAEVLCEVNKGPNAQAYKLINDIRARVGIKAIPNNLNKDQFIEALLRERCLEFGYEEVRWFDLVRRNRVNDFTKKLYGLRSKGDDANHPTKFTFKVEEIPNRYWADKWDSKWYFTPIPQDEINKGYGMTQNPGW